MRRALQEPRPSRFCRAGERVVDRVEAQGVVEPRHGGGVAEIGQGGRGASVAPLQRGRQEGAGPDPTPPVEAEGSGDVDRDVGGEAAAEGVGVGIKRRIDVETDGRGGRPGTELGGPVAEPIRADRADAGELVRQLEAGDAQGRPPTADERLHTEPTDDPVEHVGAHDVPGVVERGEQERHRGGVQRTGKGDRGEQGLDVGDEALADHASRGFVVVGKLDQSDGTIEHPRSVAPLARPRVRRGAPERVATSEGRMNNPAMDFRFADQPSARAFGYHAWDDAPPGSLPARRLHGTDGDPCLHVCALRGRVVVELHHRFSPGGGMDITEPHGQTWQSAPDHLDGLCPPLTASQVAALRALYDDPRRWDEAAWTAQALACFCRRTARGADAVSVEEADFYELGRSVAGDGTVPFLTLRLGRAHDEIVVDHHLTWPSRERRIEMMHRFDPPDSGNAHIADLFGDDVARAAEAFQRDRARWFAVE